jgi:two-component system LytT family sensor kinase
MARGRYEMTEARHELPADGLRLRPSELLGIGAAWLFLALLTAAGRLLDPRVFDIRPEVTSGLIKLAFIEYGIWALLTVPIFWLADHATAAEGSRTRRMLFLVVLGLMVAIAVDSVLRASRMYLLPRPPGRRFQPGLFDNVVRFEFLDDLMIYFAVLGAALARNYFRRYQSRLDETRRLSAEAIRLQALLAGARLDALRSQLNPHFLFNTLNAVGALVERDPRGVRRMIARLSDLLRYTLDESQEQEITVEREVDLLQRYLDIMDVRFQGGLQTSIVVDDDVRTALVPNLVLQPLVENAFKHGVTAVDGGSARVDVTARREGDQLVLTVGNNGPSPINAVDGVGLANTRNRLRELFGTAQQFELRAADGGAIAEIRLPFHTTPLARAISNV